MIKTVVFDIGNVVWRFRPTFNSVFRGWAKLMGITLHQFRLHFYEKDGLYRKFETDTLDLTDWLREIAPDQDPKSFLKIMDEKFRDPKNFSRYLNPEVIKYISKLRRSGIPVGCLSNTEKYFYPYLKKHVLPYFDYHLLSWQVASRKPDSKIYREIFKHGKFLPSEILFIDDVPINVAAAKKIGLNAILFTGTASLKTALSDYHLL